MSNVKELFNNKWVSIMQKTMDNGCEYVYSHSPWCGGEGVAVLPYRNVGDRTLFLGRMEVCPAHSEEIELCSITGGMDITGESPMDTAIRELKEEAGYSVTPDQMFYLGTVRPSKSSDGTNHIFTVELPDDLNYSEPTGDGTLGEEGAYCRWVGVTSIVGAKDPLLHAALVRITAENLL